MKNLVSLKALTALLAMFLLGAYALTDYFRGEMQTWHSYAMFAVFFFAIMDNIVFMLYYQSKKE